MNPYDSDEVRAVWARVTANGQETTPPEEQLQELIADELTDCASYRVLSRCCGRFSAVFRAIAADELRHAKRLSALYVLHYGCIPTPYAGAYDCRPCLCTALHEHYEAEQKGAKVYEDLATRFPQHEALFCSLAADERCHAERLTAIAEAIQ